MWLNDDNTLIFEENISQLDGIFQAILNCSDEAQMQSKDVTKAFHILRGIFGGAHTHRHFCIVFDWFYPQYFGIIQKSLIAFIENPKIVNLIFQFLSELLDNTGNRLRFDTWNINGLIIYKESSNFMA